MRHYRVRKWLYKAIGWVEAGSSALIVPLAALLRLDPAKIRVHPLLAPLLLWLLGLAPILILMLALCGGASALARRLITSPQMLAIIQSILNRLQEETFKEENDTGEPLHDHRVTIFKHCRRLFRLGGWLVPVARSGHITQGTEIIFRAGDNPTKLEGIAGRAWALASAVVVEDLPDLNHRSSPATWEKSIEEYSTRTFVTSEWLRRRLSQGKPLALSYYGIHVEVRGAKWGVLVIDSKKPKAKVGPADLTRYRFVAGLLEKVLEGM